MTYYLQYRPQTISSLDLVSVRNELEAVLASGRFPHAYLFAGPRGTGKTSAARIMAKVVNCERNAAGTSGKNRSALKEPCNKCLSCRSITDGSSLDLFEIDAASNRGIDDVRDLRERIKLSPAKARYKVYIIDEVHMLTTEAFNALLKTLEEPPGHALFFLCTTAPEKLPETVISRCTRVNFRKASETEIVSSLKKVVKGEKLAFEDGVLEAIAGSADGSFRDAQKILEQAATRLSVGKGKRKIGLALVSQVIGMSGEESVRRLLTLLSQGEMEKALAEIGEVSSTTSLEHYTRELLDLLRRLLLTEVGVLEEEKVEGLDLSAIKRLIGLFSVASGRLRTAVIAELPLELAVVEWFAGQQKTQDAPVGREKNAPRPALQPRAEALANRKKGKVSFSQIQKQWPEILRRLKPKNHSLEALLKAASPREVKGEVLLIEVAYPFHKQQLELSRYKAMVESAIREVLTEKVRLQYVLRKLSEKKIPDREQHENVSGAVEDEKIIRMAEEVFGQKTE